MRLLTTLTAALSLTASITATQTPLQDTTLGQHDVCDCRGIDQTTPNPTWHLCGNASLGPLTLPWRFPMLSFVSNYDRFGKLTPSKFLETWRYYNESRKQWRWKYPEQDGFQIDADGKPIRSPMILKKGLKVDRFGPDTGSFIAAADSPFNQRSLPPDALNVCPNPDDCKPKDHPWNYHIYEVVVEFKVLGGPIAPAFEQTGLGTQFQLWNETKAAKNETYVNNKLSDVVAWGWLKPVPLNSVELGPGPTRPAEACGKVPVNCTCDKPK